MSFRNAIFGHRFLPKDPAVQLDNLHEGEHVEVKMVETIMFDIRLIDDVEKCKTQKDQILLLSITMLHEMIHQYCFENGIKDEGYHDDGWYEIARQHGLEHGVSDDGQSWESIDQWKAYWLKIYFRLR